GTTPRANDRARGHGEVTDRADPRVGAWPRLGPSPPRVVEWNDVPGRLSRRDRVGRADADDERVREASGSGASLLGVGDAVRARARRSRLAAHRHALATVERVGSHTGRSREGLVPGAFLPATQALSDRSVNCAVACPRSPPPRASP